MYTPQEIADRYAAIWNEADATKRRQLIEAFFAPQGEHYVKTREAIGYDALERRVVGSHEKNVRDGGYIFRAAPGAQLLRNIVTFNWHMTPASDPSHIVAVGLEFLVLDDQGLATKDYQFIIA